MNQAAPVSLALILSVRKRINTKEVGYIDLSTRQAFFCALSLLNGHKVNFIGYRLSLAVVANPGPDFFGISLLAPASTNGTLFAIWQLYS
jgi:hypothetical protein